MLALMIYMVSIVLIGSLVEMSSSNNAKKIYLQGVFIIAFLYSALRGANVGLDTRQYYRIFNNIAMNGISSLPRNTEMEKGYMLLCWGLSKIVNHPQIVIVVTSGVICYGFYRIIKDYSDDYMLSCLIFVTTIFTITLNISRQYMALAIIFFALKHAFRKEKMKTLFGVILAISIHYSMAIFLPMIILSFDKISLNKRMSFIIGGISFLAVPLYMSIISIITVLLPQYSRFLESTKYTSDTELSIETILFFIVIFALLVCCFKSICFDGFLMRKCKNKYFIENERGNLSNNDVIFLFFVLMFVEYVVLYLISSKLWIANRLVGVFKTSLIILLPNILQRLQASKRFGVVTVLILFFIIYYLKFGYQYYLIDPHGILPYEFFWVK
ncbi:EpsG family protein [Dorea formicigenerans]|uniref:EpsG family protein n=1 Tax=Dorea formicigenerans TaxID=39486 RepID=A0A3E4PL12_9FIRM|nr:EpsG family protein [Dorea formicigenerans]RGK80711.1 EpsG family protein [Dorea formicigenerans]RHA67244.1 EpsG family protein [Dorea formicigenerans]